MGQWKMYTIAHQISERGKKNSHSVVDITVASIDWQYEMNFIWFQFIAIVRVQRDRTNQLFSIESALQVYITIYYLYIYVCNTQRLDLSRNVCSLTCIRIHIQREKEKGRQTHIDSHILSIDVAYDMHTHIARCLLYIYLFIFSSLLLSFSMA